MLREEARSVVGGGSPTWDCATSLDWREVDRALRDIARRRAKLDAEEARWLREAERLEIWRPLGMVSALDYLERVLGHTPHVANERLRVARALGDLPALTEAFASGELSFSAIRELTRVATPATETRWRDLRREVRPSRASAPSRRLSVLCLCERHAIYVGRSAHHERPRRVDASRFGASAPPRGDLESCYERPCRVGSYPVDSDRAAGSRRKPR